MTGRTWTGNGRAAARIPSPVEGGGPLPSAAETERHVKRIAEGAAIEAAQALLLHGFDEARASGADLVLRHGRTTWIVINRVRHEAGIRGLVQEQLARFVVSNLVSLPPSMAHRS